MSGGASADSKMSMVLPLVCGRSLIYIFTQLPAITATGVGISMRQKRMDLIRMLLVDLGAVGDGAEEVAAAAGGAARTYRRMRSGQAASRKPPKHQSSEVPERTGRPW